MNNEEIYRNKCIQIFEEHHQDLEEVGAYISRHWISDDFRTARKELSHSKKTEILRDLSLPF